ncbi:MAG: GNAT family N-acetyltransferase [Defluviicoccus sp.]|nr:GNAT family N-acetyltransferase [Defluviicoccus sp.]
MQDQNIRVIQADLSNALHQTAIVEMIDVFSKDQLGRGQELAADVRNRLVAGLRAHPTTLVLLAYVGNIIAGVAICFGGFSTFSAKPLLNIHDLIVEPDYRGRGVGKALLAAAEDHARQRGCCKLTLEVLDNNAVALSAYTAAGYVRFALRDGGGEMVFLSKTIE